MIDKPVIRKYESSDFERLMEIENSCFSSPWSKELMKSSLEGSLYTTYVAEYGGAVCGYANVFTVAGTPDANDGDTELMNIAVLSDYRRKGIADELLKLVAAHAEENRCSKIFLEVRESNIPAINLYKKHGFKVYGLRKNYYESPRENAILMSYDINGELC